MDIRKTLAALTAGAAALLLTAASFAAPPPPYQNITPWDAAQMVENVRDTYILDVRTDSEWTWVGHPGENRQGEGAYLDGKVVNISYLIEKPDGSTKVNPHFVEDVFARFDGDRHVNLISMCRSGGRSVQAALALDEAGFKNIYNMTTGFEGGRDAKGYRTVSGWKVDGLPYTDGREGAYTLEVYLGGGDLVRLLEYLSEE
jgi:rhodanese-related sulfurtransferase